MDDMRISLNGIQCEVVPPRPAPPQTTPKLAYYVQVGLFRYPENVFLGIVVPGCKGFSL